MAAMKQTGIDEGTEIGKEIGEKIGKALGEEIGINKAKIEMVQNMLNKNMSLKDIAEIANLNVTKINQIKKELENEN